MTLLIGECMTNLVVVAAAPLTPIATSLALPPVLPSPLYAIIIMDCVRNI